MNINLKMLKNDFKRNRAGNVALLLFMTLAASLVVSATIVIMQLISSMVGMYTVAQPPHFLQMHKGAINREAIDSFASTNEEVKAWQIVDMIDIEGDELEVYGDDAFSLSDCYHQISLVKQNKEYDLLLDENRNKIQLNKGEIGIPMLLLDAYNIKIGDKVVLTSNGVTKTFKVTEFVHDAQMNSTLCYSTRMLISDEDFKELNGKVGENEYLIEVYFADSSEGANFQTSYENAGLPQNGPAITFPMIILLSAMTDIMMALILILVSVLLVIVAFICIKYTVMAAMEEEISEIGTMKAIGMSYQDIRGLYLEKYKIIVGIGITVGYILGLIASNKFTGHITSTFGNQPVSMFTFGFPIVMCILVYLITNHYCKKILRKLKKVTVVEALVNAEGLDEKERVRDGLHRSKTMPVNILLGIREILQNFRGFIIIFIVVLISSSIMIVPMNLSNTIRSKEFILYMGSAMEDISIEIEQGENLEEKYKVIKNILMKDTDIKEYKEYRSVRVETINSQNEWMNLQVECGKDSGSGIKYLSGKEPTLENEMALSKLNADEVGKNTGDKLLLSYGGELKEFIICGVYQDVTGGGKTAKAIYDFRGLDAIKYQFTINLIDGVNVEQKVSFLDEQVGRGYAILSTDEFINQTVGGVANQVDVVTKSVVVIGVFLEALIVVLFMKLRLIKDAPQIAAMKAMGFTNADVKKQYLCKILLVATLGIATGTIVSNTLGQSLVSLVFNVMGFGISKITFIINPWIAFILLPLVIFAVVAIVTWISTRQIREYNIISLINE